MTQRSYAGEIVVHPSEVFEARGKTDSGREISVYFNAEQIEKIIEAYKTSRHYGHAYWHVKNPAEPFLCEGCHKE